MKKKAIPVSLALVAIAIVAVPFAVAARGERLGHGFGRHAAIFGILQHVKGELDITKAQETQLRAIAREVREENRAYREAMRKEMKDVAALLIANPNDIAGAEALLEAQEATRDELRANALQAISRGLNVLTPEQRTELGELLQRHASRAPRF